MLLLIVTLSLAQCATVPDAPDAARAEGLAKLRAIPGPDSLVRHYRIAQDR